MRSQAPFSQPRLVFLHIPKTAGTSIREIIKSVYGAEATAWHTFENNSALERARTARYSEKQFQGKLFLGGHKPRSFYPPSGVNLYCSMVREPIERVKSLFSYYTRPAAASGERDYEIRQRQLESWLRKGIDPDSLVNSIERCPPFRRVIDNMQCSYISRAGKSFDDAMATITHENFLLGNSRQVKAMIEKLADLLEWPETPEIFGNVSRAGVNDNIVSEAGAVDIINHHCAEDLKLYRFICDENNGLYCNLPNRDLIVGSALNCGPLAKKEISRIAWRKIRVECRDPLAINNSELQLVVNNGSREYLNPDLGKGLFLVYRLIDHQGREIHHECARTRLAKTVLPGDSFAQSVPIKIPEPYLAQTSAIRVCMLHAGKYWIDKVDPDHAQVIPVAGQGADASVRNHAGKIMPGGSGS